MIEGSVRRFARQWSCRPRFAQCPDAERVDVSGGSLQNYLRSREELMQRANEVIAGVRAGWLKLNIARVLPLAQAAEAHEAHELLESRKTEGKLVLAVANS
jgi:NADPH2:quinone reductase